MPHNLEPHEKVYRTKKRIIIDNFVGGIAWAIGATLGAAIIITVLSSLLNKLDFVPLVGDFVSSVTEYMEKRTPNQNFQGY